ncbi:MAG: serine/threonine-protein kinase, partial [Planctomycetota bacterium]|nr:serine/threonine-protein kinase [Planctomycetota bacterium]
MTEDPRKKQVAELLQATLDLNATDRQRYLDENCGADPELKREVLRLVELQGASSGFLEDAAEKIGNYRILGTLGEGGMGVVYLAEQKEPIRRRVALKLIKLGMDTKEVIARFEAERNALALMNHPNIARVYDAGATEDGRPYFAMEHVEGVPITDFCQRHRINVPERLELFLQVCRGVDHAHHRGVLHRDIKPSNILVGIADEKPVAKIIDFGVARATNQRLTEKTIYTEIGRAVGTPAYMSPEQADLTGEGVDHRTDVYSLGVLLYELLVGQLPLDIDVQTVAFDEMVRRIREDEPLLPSVRWSRLNPERTTKLAAERQTRSSSVQQQIRGDLDWICMKAIEKDRERRYSSAAHIAEDITRHLKGEPASAGPPSVLYRVGKYVRRHRGLVGATVAVGLALTVGLVASVLFALDARKHATRADEKAFEAGESEKLARDRLEEVLLLSDIQRLTDLDGEAQALWPALPAKVEPMREWLKKATELTERLGKHRAALSSLRENALRHDEVARARDRESHPRLEELGRWKRLRQNRLEEANRLENAAESPATVLSYGEDPLRKPITVYFRRAFEAAASDTE